MKEVLSSKCDELKVTRKIVDRATKSVMNGSSSPNSPPLLPQEFAGLSPYIVNYSVGRGHFTTMIRLDSTVKGGTKLLLSFHVSNDKDSP